MRAYQSRHIAVLITIVSITQRCHTVSCIFNGFVSRDGSHIVGTYVLTYLHSNIHIMKLSPCILTYQNSKLCGLGDAHDLCFLMVSVLVVVVVIVSCAYAFTFSFTERAIRSPTLTLLPVKIINTHIGDNWLEHIFRQCVMSFVGVCCNGFVYLFRFFFFFFFILNVLNFFLFQNWTMITTMVCKRVWVCVAQTK